MRRCGRFIRRKLYRGRGVLGALVGCLHPFNLVLYGAEFRAQRTGFLHFCRGLLVVPVRGRWVWGVYTALSDLTIAPPFIPPIAKTGNVLSFLFFCLATCWCTCGVLGALVGCLVHLCTFTLVLYGARWVRNRGIIFLCRAFLFSYPKG